MKVKYYLFLLVTLFSTVPSFSQVIDQDHLINYGSIKEAVTFGQSFTAGLSGRLSRFDFRYSDGGAYNYKCELKIYSGTGVTGTLLKTQPFVISQSVQSGIAQITISNGPVVVAGSIYSAVITVLSGPPNGKMRYRYITNNPNYQDGTPTDSYPGGILLFNTDTYSKDMGFKTYVTEAPATHLNFDGVNDYITLSNENSFDFTNEMTVEFWMNSNTTPEQWDALVTKGDDSWRIALTGDGKVNFACGGTSFGSVTSNASVIDGNWHHLAFTFNGSNAIIYIDGVQNASISGTGSMNNSAYNVAIGENLQATGRYYTGSMDEVRIWNIARSATEISGAKNCELSGSESGLLAYYKFNQGMGYVNNTSITSLTDATSNSNNGTFNGFALNGITSNFVTSEGFNAPSLPTLSAPVIFSQTNPASVVSASIGSLLWYTTATGGTSSTTPPTLTFSGNGSASYWISAINSRGCETTRVELVVVNAAAIPVTPTAVPIQLYKGNGTLANLTATGTNLEWFSTSIGGAALALSTVLVDNTTYYVSQSPQGVRSPRISVKAKKISESTQVFCSTTSVADLIATPSSSATAKWFSNSTDSTPLASSDAVSTGSLYVEQNIVSATTSIGTGFLKPEGIFVDASGSVYVADTENNAVKKMDANGTTFQTIGSGFYKPLDVTVDVLGNIYVFDSNLKGIVKMDSQGNNKALIYDIGGAPVQFSPSPPRLFTDRLGNIYLHHGYSVIKMDNNGGNVQQILSTVNGIFAMTLDELGNIYIVHADELKKVDATTGTVSILASGFFYARNLIVDRFGTIYYYNNYELRKINGDGTNIQVVATNFGWLKGLSMDESGNFYIAAYNNTESDVKKINPNFTSNRVAVAMSVETLTVPTFTAAVFIQGATPTALTATSNGTGLLWYTAATGGTGNTTAPTPSTATVGTTSYWVSSTSNAGCESARVEMAVTVTLPATHLSFDGTNDFVNIGSVISPGSSYTKEALIKANAVSGNYNILSSAGDVFWISNNQISAGHTSSFSHVTASASSLLNSWNHVAVTYDAPSKTMKMYINGNLVSTNTNVQATAGNAMQIGAYTSLVTFNGSMDDVRIWNVARTQAQLNGYRVCELQGNEPGLIAYYNFNQGTGGVSNTAVTSLINSVSGGANGTLQNFGLSGASSNWLAGSPIVSGVVIPSIPSVTSPITYFQNNTATVLTATSDGTGLLWYTVATGGTGSTTAPTPSTATVGSTSYWVSSTNANGCESERAQIIVSVNEFTTPGCWKQISFGSQHTIAIAENGTLWGWGSNSYYQLGLGTGSSSTQSLPVQIGTANNWKSISANGDMAMAITTSGTLWSFGRSGSNGLGTGFNAPANFPVQVGSASDWESVSVSLSGEFCLAVKTSGTLWSWGRDNRGALGLDSELSNLSKYAPVQVGTATHWKSVSAGKDFSFAVTTSGALWAWGNNTYGQLGLGDTTTRYEPVQVGTATDWKTIETGQDYAMAVKTSGTLWSWGFGEYGKLGLGNTNSVSTPTQIGTATDWKNISAGLFHTLAVTTSGTLWSWGYNNYGQLGIANSTNQNAPLQVGNNTNWDSLSTTVFSSGALTTSGTLFTWGYNSSSQLGIGNSTNKNIPTGVNCPTCATEDVATPTVTSPVLISQGSTPSALTAVSGGTGLLWLTDATDGAGSTTAPMPSTTNPNITSYWVSSTNANGCKSARVEIRVEVTPSVEANCWKQISMSQSHTLAIAQNGTLWAWGSNSSGSLGIGNLVSSSIPVQVGNDNHWVFISVGNNFSTAITTSGTLWAWGNNFRRQLGLGDTTNRNIPVQIGSATDWKFISASDQYCIAIKTSGTLWSWGEGSDVLGQGNVFQISVPTQIGTATHWKTVSASPSHVVAITTSGTLWAWGYNGDGLYLGLGAEVGSKSAPFQVGTASNWKMVSASNTHTLALTTSGTLWGWGRNYGGALGIPSINEAKVPMQVGTETHWQSISSGYNFSLAVTNSGTLWSWGDNYLGQLGQGNTKSKVEPVQVGTATNWKNIEIGYSNSAAITDSGALNVWGYNQDGILGLGNAVQRNVPNGVDCPSCVAVTVWDGTAWSNGLPNNTKNTVFTGDYTGVGFDACSIQVAPAANVVINTAENLEILNEVQIASDATFTLENNTNLVQITDKANSGNALVKRNSSPMIRLDYTAWGSPVMAQKLLAFSPATLANRFYTYDPSATLQSTAWVPVANPSTTDFVTGKGYFVRVPNTWSATVASPFLGKFTGVLNNGIVTIPSTLGYNLVGNPYPSAIEVTDFITDNASRGVSALYYWTHASVATNGAYLQNNYASRTLLGGTAAAPNGIVPDEYIQVGQGFFANTTSNGNLVFNNAMRTKQSNNQFFKAANTITDKHRYWLNLNDATTGYNQILVGYLNGATNGYDQGIDGVLMTTSTSFIASKINNDKYVIQGRNGSFDVADEVDLAFTANANGVFTIALDAFDGLFVNQNLFLWDKQLHVKHNLKESGYSFSTAAGTFDDRFAVVYQNSNLDTPVFDTHLLLVYVDLENFIQFSNPNQNIESISIYDVMGRLLYSEKNIQKNKTAIFNAFEKQVLVVKTTLQNGTINTAKITN